MEGVISTKSDPFVYVNEIKYEITRDCDPEMSLNDFLREVLELKGTKVMCREAGCGCCTVCAIYKHPATGEVVSKPVNSCITPLYSTVGWHIVTVEGIGSAQSGYHPIQAKLADGYGSQCGYCTPGFVMSMFSQLQETPKPTQEQVEHFLDGNICRCTGYRPILNAMKSFACDKEGGQCVDLEDLGKGCCKTKVGSVPTCGVAPLAKGWGGQKFYNPGSLSDLVTILGRIGNESYRLVHGNTSTGVYKEDIHVDHYVNVRNVPELHKVESTGAGLVIGANVTLHELINIYDKYSSEGEQYSYLQQVSSHYQQVANQAVRRNATWAGNLMIKHAHPEFPSDVFVTMEAAKAIVRVLDATGEKEYILTDFLQTNMTGKVIVSALMPKATSKNQFYRSFKVTPRTLNAHAYVNAGFNFAIDKSDNYRVVEKPSIVYGGISHKFVHATKTENFLLNKNLLDEETVKGAVQVLEGEVNPVEEVTSSSPQHRRSLAANLMYKFILAVGGDTLQAMDISGGRVLERPVQQSQQSYEEFMQPDPLGKAMPKLEARAQAAGEAKYANDFPAHTNELYASFVQATEAPAELKGFDTSEAERVPGYQHFVTAKDLKIRFDNNITSALLPPAMAQREDILVEKDIKFAGQPVAIVLAKSQWAADRAASLVVVEFDQTGEPITSVAEAVAKNSVLMPMPEQVVGEENFTETFEKQANKVEGQVLLPEQVHFSIETLTATSQPTEEGLLITAPHQWADEAVMTMSRVLRRPANQIRIVSPRIGGGFGGKLIMIDLVIAAVSICSELYKKPVRMYMTLNKHMELCMKRPGFLLKYTGSTDADGKLQAVSWDISMEAGHTCNMQAMIVEELKHTIDLAFFCPNYKLATKIMRTDKPQATFVRGPGPAPAAMANLILMDHLAYQAGIDPIEFKRRNLYREGDNDILGNRRANDNFQRMWDEMVQLIGLDKRRQDITEFNKNNRFRKRGLDMSASSYHIGLSRGRASQVFLTVQAVDGTLTLTHSAAEMGQGLGVKCAQAVAGILDIDINLIKIKPTDTHVTPNNDVTGGSASSELNTKAAIDAAEQLNERLKPIREANPEADWPALIAIAMKAGVLLAVVGKCNIPQSERKGGHYSSTGVGAVEVEVDILTGEYQIRRADIMMDLGKSLNPGVDVGQIEGAFVMGLGHFLMERTLYDADNARNITNGTWNYKVPQAADTPRDFRVHILKGTDNKAGILSTKAVGEPPICLAPLSVTAIKRAVEAFRQQQGKPSKFLTFDLPLTPEKVMQMAEVSQGDRKVLRGQ